MSDTCISSLLHNGNGNFICTRYFLQVHSHSSIEKQLLTTKLEPSGQRE